MYLQSKMSLCLQLCGASINRIGYKTFSITLIGDKDVCNMLMTKVNEII